MRRLLAFAVLALGSTIAHANRNDAFVVVGMGPAMAEHDAGWALRVEGRFDATDRVDDGDDNAPLLGAGYGLETWSAGDHKGFAMPVGFYVGGQSGHVRTSLGGGVGLWAFEKHAGSDTHFGVAPYASSSLEIRAGNLLLTIEGRLARQVVLQTTDYNVYSVMFKLGRRGRN